MKRYQRLQLDEAFLGLALKEKWVARSRDKPPADRDDLVLGRAYDLPDTAHLAAVAFYLTEDYAKARQYAEMCITSAHRFFFGDWRKAVSTPSGMVEMDWLRTHHRWMGVYEGALLWGGVLADWAKLEQIAGYADVRCRVDADYSESDLNLFLAIAAILKKSPQKDVEGYLKTAELGANKTQKLFASCLLDLSCGSQASLQSGLAAYLKQFRKVDFPKPILTNKISVHGTILVHLARRAGMQLTVESAFLDHIVDFS